MNWYFLIFGKKSFINPHDIMIGLAQEKNEEKAIENFNNNFNKDDDKVLCWVLNCGKNKPSIDWPPKKSDI